MILKISILGKIAAFLIPFLGEMSKMAKILALKWPTFLQNENVHMLLHHSKFELNQTTHWLKNVTEGKTIGLFFIKREFRIYFMAFFNTYLHVSDHKNKNRS